MSVCSQPEAELRLVVLQMRLTPVVAMFPCLNRFLRPILGANHVFGQVV